MTSDQKDVVGRGAGSNSLSSPLVHIGYHKTATTWLQKELFSFGSSAFYPLCPTRLMSHALQLPAKYMGQFFYRDEEGFLMSPFMSHEHIRARVTKELATICESGIPEGKMPVISNERLSGNPYNGAYDAKAIADSLFSVFPLAKVLIVVREQEAMIMSMYFQYLRRCGTADIQVFLCQPYDESHTLFSLDHLAYDQRVAYSQALFGEQNVLVLPYELFRADPDTFLKRLSALCGIPINVEEYPVERRHNEGRNHLVEGRFRWLNLFIQSTSLNAYSPFYSKWSSFAARGLKHVLTRMTSRAREEAYIRNLREQIHEIVGNRYGRSNAALESITGLDLASFGYSLD